MDQVLVTTGVAEDVGEAHGRADGHDKLLARECDQEGADDGHRVRDGIHHDRVEQRLGTLEADHRDLVATVRKLDERLSRVEKRLDELVGAQRDYASRAEVHELRTRLDGLQTRLDSIEQRLKA